MSGPGIGAWLSLVERCVRDAEVGGSNPLAPTTNDPPCKGYAGMIRFVLCERALRLTIG
jgi:hypothetical protein